MSDHICKKCGSKFDRGNFCPSCGTPATGGQQASFPNVITVKKQDYSNGYLISIVVGIAIAVGICVASRNENEKNEKKNMAESSAITAEAATTNGENLVAWIRDKKNMTDMVKNDAFAKLKGKTVQLTGVVREVRKADFTDEPYVSLTIGKLNAFERINVRFNVRKSEVAKVRAWNKGEVHTLRGRISEQGGIVDDAECDIAVVVE